MYVDRTLAPFYSMLGLGQQVKGKGKGKGNEEVVSQPGEASFQVELSNPPQTTTSQGAKMIPLYAAVEGIRCRQRGCKVRPFRVLSGRDEHEGTHEILDLVCENTRCDESFPSIDEIGYHEATAHYIPGPDPDLNCYFCQRPFNAKQGRATHETKYHGEEVKEAKKVAKASDQRKEYWVCRIQGCIGPRTFPSRPLAKQHATVVHGNSDDPIRFACRWFGCRRRPPNGNAQDLHEKLHQQLLCCWSGECDFTDSEFPDLKEKGKHNKSSHPVKYWCNVEKDAFFSSEEKMKQHLGEAHPEWVRAHPFAAQPLIGSASRSGSHTGGLMLGAGKGTPQKSWVCRLSKCSRPEAFFLRGVMLGHIKHDHDDGADPNRFFCRWFECTQYHRDETAQVKHEVGDHMGVKSVTQVRKILLEELQFLLCEFPGCERQNRSSEFPGFQSENELSQHEFGFHQEWLQAGRLNVQNQRAEQGPPEEPQPSTSSGSTTGRIAGVPKGYEDFVDPAPTIAELTTATSSFSLGTIPAPAPGPLAKRKEVTHEEPSPREAHYPPRQPPLVQASSLGRRQRDETESPEPRKRKEHKSWHIHNISIGRRR